MVSLSLALAELCLSKNHTQDGIKCRKILTTLPLGVQLSAFHLTVSCSLRIKSQINSILTNTNTIFGFLSQIPQRFPKEHEDASTTQPAYLHKLVRTHSLAIA